MSKDNDKERPVPAPSKKADPKQNDAKELDVQELEERIAPMRF